MNGGPIFIVDDDIDDQELVKEIMKELGYPNEVKSFNYAEQVIAELKDKNSNPFIIISDINLPGMDGFELRKKLNTDKISGYKAIPFIFWSNFASDAQVRQAYDAGGHGFFIKESTVAETRTMLKDIIRYWFLSKVPHDL